MFFYGVVVVSLALIVPVPVVDIIHSLVFSPPADGAGGTGYPLKEIMVGLLSEITRAFITCYLYAATVGKGSSLLHGIKFGLLYSGLIASLYIILGGFYFKVANPMHFIVTDSLILIIQGIASGIALYYTYRQDKPAQEPY